MALPDAYVQIYGQLPDILKRLSDGQAPEKFTVQYLKDIGFQSTNHRAVIPLLKALGFLSADGTPTGRYHNYRDHSQSRKIMGEALREAYSDLFTIKARPTDADRALIEGKFKSAHNTGERTAKLMTSTFYSLLSLADLDAATPSAVPLEEKKPEPPPTPPSDKHDRTSSHRPSLHYNIEIHLPATKDVEVFNAIFKSLREHLLD
ncbi:DUF5343 domain-containing protein [Bradyrhizobium sp. A5]|uniref:DUF5343 domain-containing protein n=1 Tax=Bradyrhizobium sp. A5 TaxID=3133696 RepID=UPI00324F485B